MTVRWVAAVIINATLSLSGCGVDDDNDVPSAWTWTELGGPDAEVSPLTANHEPLVVTGTHLLLGTADGVWRRALSGTDTWERVGLDDLAIHAIALTQDGAVSSQRASIQRRPGADGMVLNRRWHELDAGQHVGRRWRSTAASSRR